MRIHMAMTSLTFIGAVIQRTNMAKHGRGQSWSIYNGYLNLDIFRLLSHSAVTEWTTESHEDI